jgi:iron(III) transport system permease protein
VSVAVLLPLAFLIVQAVQLGWAELHQLLFRSLTATLIWNTVSLVVVVTVLSAVVGTLAAWFVERTDVPLRRLLAILVVIPLGIPDFVVSFGWKAIFPSIAGFWAAVLVMTRAECARFGLSRWARRAWPSSVGPSWSGWSCWPSSALSRSWAIRP